MRTYSQALTLLECLLDTGSSRNIMSIEKCEMMNINDPKLFKTENWNVDINSINEYETHELEFEVVSNSHISLLRCQTWINF